MTVARDIFATYHSPGETVARLIATGPREDRSLAILMAGSVLNFIARSPVLARTAGLGPDVPLEARLGITLFAALFMVPLLAYGVALILHLGVRLAGRQGQAWRARIALFWALLAIAPAMLVQGVIETAGQPGRITQITGLATFGLFIWFVAAGLSRGYPKGAK
jgi:hypothetical protein